MVSSYLKKILLSAVILALTAACQPSHINTPDLGAEDLIGIPLSQNSKLQSSTEEDSDKVVVFDKTIRKIHHFDLESSQHIGLYTVDKPEEEHYLLYNSGQDYFIDMTKKNISIQKIGGERVLVPLKFVGTPVSASFDSKQGYLVLYDHLQSVMILKIDAKGNVIATPYISGPVLNSEGTIQAGDIFENGKLVLSIRGNPQETTGTQTDFIFAVDIEQTIAAQNTSLKLQGEKIPTSLTQMSWIAPVLGYPNLMLIRSSGKVSLFDLTAKAVVTSMPTDDWVVEKYSKIKDAHIILRKKYEYDYKVDQKGIERHMYYVEGGALKTRSLTKNFSFILNSHLDLKRGQWNVTKAEVIKEMDLFNSYNGDYKKRTFTRMRVNDLLSVIDSPIEDEAIVEMSGNYLFSLFPSDLGYATKTDVESNKTSVIKNFNIKYLK